MIQQFKTIEELNQKLNQLQKPKWLKGLVVHHTYTPQVHEWRGLKTMLGMRRHYNTLGWSGFPHFFIAPDGIWTMNDLDKIGIHSNAANSFTYGIEVVGRYDNDVWQDPIKKFAVQTIAALIKWSKLSVYHIYPHRQFNLAKSCPGTAIRIQDIQNLIMEELLRPKIDPIKVYRVVVEVARIRQGPSLDYLIAGKLYSGDILQTAAIKKDEKVPANSWAHVTQCTNRDGVLDNIGFVRTDLLEEIV